MGKSEHDGEVRRVYAGFGDGEREVGIGDKGPGFSRRFEDCKTIMLCMPKITISIREFQQNLKRVLARVERGQVIEVTRRRRPVARQTPLSSEDRPPHGLLLS